MSFYRVGGMSRDEFDPAFALIHLVRPSLDLDGWRGFCAIAMLDVVTQQRAKVSIIVARMPHGHLPGIAIGMSRPDSLYGRVLDVSLFLVISAVDEHGIAAELLDGLRRLAMVEGCGALRFWPPEKGPWPELAAEPDHDGSLLMLLYPGGDYPSDGWPVNT